MDLPLLKINLREILKSNTKVKVTYQCQLGVAVVQVVLVA
jgi:hypothetical protein